MQKATVLILAILLLLPLATIQDDEGGQENTARRASDRGYVQDRYLRRTELWS
nr:contulakin M5 [Conus magus]